MPKERPASSCTACLSTNKVCTSMHVHPPQRRCAPPALHCHRRPWAARCTRMHRSTGRPARVAAVRACAQHPIQVSSCLRAGGSLGSQSIECKAAHVRTRRVASRACSAHPDAAPPELLKPLYFWQQVPHACSEPVPICAGRAAQQHMQVASRQSRQLSWRALESRPLPLSHHQQLAGQCLAASHPARRSSTCGQDDFLGLPLQRSWRGRGS